MFPDIETALTSHLTDLWVVITQSNPRTSALGRALDGDEHPWGHNEQLLAAVVDNLAVANWQRAEGKKAEFPKPVPRPGIDTSKKYGGEGVSMDTVNDQLGWETHERH